MLGTRTAAQVGAAKEQLSGLTAQHVAQRLTDARSSLSEHAAAEVAAIRGQVEGQIAEAQAAFGEDLRNAVDVEVQRLQEQLDARAAEAAELSGRIDDVNERLDAAGEAADARAGKLEARATAAEERLAAQGESLQAVRVMALQHAADLVQLADGAKAAAAVNATREEVAAQLESRTSELMDFVVSGEGLDGVFADVRQQAVDEAEQRLLSGPVAALEDELAALQAALQERTSRAEVDERVRAAVGRCARVEDVAVLLAALDGKADVAALHDGYVSREAFERALANKVDLSTFLAKGKAGPSAKAAAAQGVSPAKSPLRPSAAAERSR